MRSLLAAEMLKLRKRWLPYIMLILLLLCAFVQVFLFGWVGWHEDPDPTSRLESLRTFSLPWSLPSLLDSGQFWGGLIVGTLAASVVATEFGWGTVRQALARGQTRAGYLMVKLTALVIVSAAGLLIVFFAAAALSLVLTAVEDRPVTLDAPGGGTSGPELVLMVLRAGYCIIPYGMLAFCLATIARSTTLGVITIVFLLFGEALLLAILEAIGGIAADVRDLTIGHNVSALMAQNHIGFANPLTLAARDQRPAAELPDPNVAAVVLALWSLAFAAISFYIFQKRDLRG